MILMKKIILILTMALLILLAIGCTKKENQLTDNVVGIQEDTQEQQVQDTDLPNQDSGSGSETIKKEPVFDFIKSKETVRLWIESHPTYSSAGAELEYRKVTVLDCKRCWEFRYRFKSNKPGFGDRSSQPISLDITISEIDVTIENGIITRAIIDGQWDELNQRNI